MGFDKLPLFEADVYSARIAAQQEAATGLTFNLCTVQINRETVGAFLFFFKIFFDFFFINTPKAVVRR